MFPPTPTRIPQTPRLLTSLYTAIWGTRSRGVKVGQLLLHVVQDPHGVVLLVGLNPIATTDFCGQELEVISSGRLDADPAPAPIGMSNLIRIGSHQRSHCCLCHEAGVPGSCGHQLGETGCQEENPAFPAPKPPFQPQTP